MADYLETTELAALIRSIDQDRDRLLARFLFESGCSISEAAAIPTAALDENGILELPDRTITIPADLARALREQAGTYLFSTRQNETITPKRIQQILKPHLIRVHEGKTTPHVLRYTHIVHAYRQGVPIQAISGQTGLTPVRIAQIVAGVPGPRLYTFQSPLQEIGSAARKSTNAPKAGTPGKNTFSTPGNTRSKQDADQKAANRHPVDETTLERARAAAARRGGSR